MSSRPPLPLAASSADYYALLLQKCVATAATRTKSCGLAGKCIHCYITKSGLLLLSTYLVNNLLNFYSKLGFFSDATNLFDQMPHKNVFSWNTLLSMYAKSGRIEIARRLFDAMPKRDSVSWTTLIVGFSKAGKIGNALLTFRDMVNGGVTPTQFTLTKVLSSCSVMEALDVGREVHCFAVKLGLGCCIPLANSLVNMYGKCRQIKMAKAAFDRMNLRSVESWNAMVSVFAQIGRMDLAMEWFNKMEERNIVSWNAILAGYNQNGMDAMVLEIFALMMKDPSLVPNNFTLTSILSACSNLGVQRLGKEIHAYILRMEFPYHEQVSNALISMYAKSGGSGSARKIVEQVDVANLSVISFTALLEGYLKVSDLEPARKIFDSMKFRDVVAWTAMIVGYAQNGFSHEAIELFRLMIEQGPKPNSYTFTAVLSICASMALLDLGKEVHCKVIRTWEENSASVSNAIITMYARSGSISSVKTVFNRIAMFKETITWSSMIIALAQHGLGEEAIDLYEKMLQIGVKPDHITYVGVISACTHAALIDKGKHYFHEMTNVFMIEPTMSHYACMVDLLSRSGLLDEAAVFISRMPVEPDTVVWGSLLSACRMHKHAGMAKYAAEKLLHLDPNNSGAYSALANVYSACGKWSDAAAIWKDMKNKGVRKEQGFSWIHVQNRVHIFGADDCLHPCREEIYNTIAKIWDEIKKAGFVPDVHSVLHDVDNELKEKLLMHHSEKLAIAFGLISTPENMTLRIMKNLRVCNDCHSAIKYISNIVDREIVLRDATRFHHFRNGSCSCKDFW